jgi:DNA-binding transcriptional LysR family regulator
VGLVGSLLGGFLFGKLGIHVVPDFWGELITATIGAVLLPGVLAGDPPCLTRHSTPTVPCSPFIARSR